MEVTAVIAQQAPPPTRNFNELYVTALSMVENIGSNHRGPTLTDETFGLTHRMATDHRYTENSH